MRLKTVAAVAISALLTAGAATVDATTPPGTEPIGSGDDAGPGGSGSSASEVTTSITIVVDATPTPADATSAGSSSTTTSAGSSTTTAAESSTTTSAAASTTTAAEPTTIAAALTAVGTSGLASEHAPQQTSEQQQSAVVTGTVVADANTGSNLETTGQQDPAGSSLPAEIATGDATAVGSNDQSTTSQGARVVLTDAATANLLQLALVINIGAALANTGLNAVSASTGATTGGSGSTGDVVTGDASATGLDIEQYITQASRQSASAGETAGSSQVAISMWMGLATSNTGTNAVVGSGSGASGGAVASGDATATGNHSVTEIEQYADILGVDRSTTNITQRATVLNVGFALANSGLNDVSGVAGGLLTAGEADDDAVAQQLFAMLLPAMLQSYGYGPAGGTVTSGSATAVGNDSATFVRQVAQAAASGDGQVDIVQDVLVANMGAAAANSGGNSLGAVRPLDRETADAVVTMAAFMAELLSLAQRSAEGGSLVAQSQGIDVPFQGLILRLDGSIGGLDTQLVDGGARANVRQISVIVSLGVSQANTGGNVTQTDVRQGAAVNALRMGDAIAVLAVDGNGNVITTGDATAANREVVVICQRADADDVACLAPPTTTVLDDPSAPTTVVGAATSIPSVAGSEVPTTAPASTSAPTSRAPGAAPLGTLPATGAGSADLAVVAMFVLAAGVAVLVSTRRRAAG